MFKAVAALFAHPIAVASAGVCLAVAAVVPLESRVLVASDFAILALGLMLGYQRKWTRSALAVLTVLVGVATLASSVVAVPGGPLTMAALFGVGFALGALLRRHPDEQLWAQPAEPLSSSLHFEHARTDHALGLLYSSIGSSSLHGDQVAKRVLELGEAMGMTRRELNELRWAALLHDVGKSAIPSEILDKPGPLTDAEFGIVKEHCRVGADMVASVASDVPMIMDAILSHHERWDGKGYPKGQAGKCIPLAGRIIAIVDVFEALIRERPYRSALTPSAAAAVIADGAGSHFDPDVVTLFLRGLNKARQLELSSADEAGSLDAQAQRSMLQANRSRRPNS